MRQHKVKKKALALSISCALAMSLTPNFYSLAYAAETDSKQQENAGETAEYSLPAVTVEAKRPDWESKLSPGTVTIIRPDDYKGEQKTLPELLKDVPGVHVREVNGKGQYTTVSVRGSTAAQVGVFVDGVLFNLGGDAAADISTIPIKNVERIEVYRGYIPARFGGTYMGGVINVVTKRPSQSNVSASVGRSSWGGHTGSLQVDAPLAGGSLMVGINRDQSDGDFRYKNYQVPYRYQQAQMAYQGKINSLFNEINDNFGRVLGVNFDSIEEYNQAISSPDFYGTCLQNALDNQWKSYGKTVVDANGNWGFIDAKYDPVTHQWISPYSSKAEWLNSPYDSLPEEIYNIIVQNSVDSYLGTNGYKDFAAEQEKIKKAYEKYKNEALRYRKNNDYKNTDAIVKWQDDHWTAKATWKKIDRHLPWGLWTGTGYGDSNTYADLDNFGFMGAKKQELTAKELLLGHRDTVGKLEWGWSVNYLKQNKDYRNEGYDDPINDKGAAYWNQPLSVWSSYDSRRIGGAIDGSYKAGNNHLLEFMANWSKEKMEVDGWGMTDFRDGDIDYRRRFRNYFEQTLFNIQLQDTITLNKAEDLWLTPSVRYNSSTVLGRSSRLKQDIHSWFNMEDEQTDSKVTWQTAFKKKVSDKLTLRSTVGTYYRLLNLYEIAGDGAGIMPRPVRKNADKLLSAFPSPEEGTQWDVSAIWDDHLLGADANIQLTYFGRKSENLLQLYRFGYDYFSYTNTARGRTNGVELQTNLSWDKWDMNLAGTYMHTKAQNTNDSPTGIDYYVDIPLAFSPEWEGSLRLTYRPDQKTSIFSEVKYVDQMFASSGWSMKQSSLTTVGLGVKHKFTKDLQLTVGVNDLFDKGPDLRLVESGLDYDGRPVTLSSQINYPLNIDCPIQGRTYYVTLQYKY